MTLEELAKIIEAADAGSRIQVMSRIDGQWYPKTDLKFWDADKEYRVAPRAMWVNETSEGDHFLYDTKEEAVAASERFTNIRRVAIKFVEAVDEGVD